MSDEDGGLRGADGASLDGDLRRPDEPAAHLLRAAALVREHGCAALRRDLRLGPGRVRRTAGVPRQDRDPLRRSDRALEPREPLDPAAGLGPRRQDADAATQEAHQDDDGRASTRQARRGHRNAAGIVVRYRASCSSRRDRARCAPRPSSSCASSRRSSRARPSRSRSRGTPTRRAAPATSATGRSRASERWPRSSTSSKWRAWTPPASIPWRAPTPGPWHRTTAKRTDGRTAASRSSSCVARAHSTKPPRRTRRRRSTPVSRAMRRSSRRPRTPTPTRPRRNAAPRWKPRVGKNCRPTFRPEALPDPHRSASPESVQNGKIQK